MASLAGQQLPSRTQFAHITLLLIESACNAGDLCSILGQEETLEKGMATHSSILLGKSHGQKSLVS